MKPASFQYLAPTTVDETRVRLADHGDAAKILAGGQSLVPMMNFRLLQPAILIDLNRVAELQYIREHQGELRIGAMTRQSALERDPLIARHAPLVAETLPYIAHPQIRNRGTIGGSLAHADPAAELPAVMIACDARFKIEKQNTIRWIDARDFFTGLFSTVIEPIELLTEIVLPAMPAHTGFAFQEVSRRHGDFALVGVAAMIALDDAGVCRDARIVLTGVGMQPMNARNAASQLIGTIPNDDVIHTVAESIDAEIDPGSDIHASADFRHHLARVLTRRALGEAIKRLRG